MFAVLMTSAFNERMKLFTIFTGGYAVTLRRKSHVIISLAFSSSLPTPCLLVLAKFCQELDKKMFRLLKKKMFIERFGLVDGRVLQEIIPRIGER